MILFLCPSFFLINHLTFAKAIYVCIYPLTSLSHALVSGHYPAEKQCEALITEFEDNGVNLIARERYVDHSVSGLPCSGVRYFSVIREPVSRAISHLKFERLSAKIVLDYLAYSSTGEDMYISIYDILYICVCVSVVIGYIYTYI